MDKNNLNILALGGIVGPILFTILVLVCASLRPDYNHMHEFISELGASLTPNARIMNFAGFLPTGLCIIGFGISLFMYMRSAKSVLAMLGASLVMVFGVGMITAGIYSCDAGCFEAITREGEIHGRVSAIAFISLILGIFILGITFRGISDLRKYMWYSLLSAVFAAFCMVQMVGSFETESFTGLWQRLILGTAFIWMGVIGYQVCSFGNLTNQRGDDRLLSN